eukprot:1149106-Pelagomonas_calceolata.AAC.1
MVDMWSQVRREKVGPEIAPETCLVEAALPSQHLLTQTGANACATVLLLAGIARARGDVRGHGAANMCRCPGQEASIHSVLHTQT